MRRKPPKLKNVQRNLAKKLQEYLDYETQAKGTEKAICNIDIYTAQHYIDNEVPKVKKEIIEKIEKYLKGLISRDFDFDGQQASWHYYDHLRSLAEDILKGSEYEGKYDEVLGKIRNYSY